MVDISPNQPINGQNPEYQTQNTVNRETLFREVVQGINNALNGASLDANFIANASIDALMMAIMAERAEVLEGALKDQVSEIRDKNQKLKTARDILGLARAHKSKSSDDDASKVPSEVIKFMAMNDIEFNKSASDQFNIIKVYTSKYTSLAAAGATPEQLAQYETVLDQKIDSYGISLKKTDWDILIENVKGWTESLTSTSQLDMTQLQSTSGKFNQSFETLSQFIAKYYRTGDKLIGNI